VIKLMCLFFISITAFAGAGDVSGGGKTNRIMDYRNQTIKVDMNTVTSGQIVYFQKYSVWENSIQSRNLCFDGENFHTKVSKCIKWDDRQDEKECAKTIEVPAIQPQTSTRMVCSKYSNSGDEDCIEYKSVPYIQSEVKTIKFFEKKDDGSKASFPYKTETLIVPTCL
jgi:hypothetical protein